MMLPREGSTAGDLNLEPFPPCKRRKTIHTVGPPPDGELDVLLDFSSTALSSTSSITERFDCIAELLFTRYRLVVNLLGTSTSREEYDILEVEFYLDKEGCHEDPYTHGAEEQRVGGQWYFHRANRSSESTYLPSTSSPSYRGGTRKGLDITLGRCPQAAYRRQTSRYFTASSSHENPTTHSADTANVRGGILLRSVRRHSDSCVVSGPSLLVDELLRVSKASSIVNLVQGHWKGDISALKPTTKNSGSSLCLKRLSDDMIPLPTTHVFCSPRVGLDISHPSVALDVEDPRIHFVIKPYRYFIHPHLLTAKGRAQTFLGVYDRLTSEAPDKDEPTIIAKMERLISLKPQTIRAYLGIYQDARTSGTLRSFMGAAGKGASSTPTTALKLYGSTRRFVET
ncbi:hypothetical protein OF83DRAFT_1096699 [Amylostereum chailletii]|nr:hypothetical protein OF83DRAFT_1096699 [Amylostereum chailletii]